MLSPGGPVGVLGPDLISEMTVPIFSIASLTPLVNGMFPGGKMENGGNDDGAWFHFCLEDRIDGLGFLWAGKSM